MGRRGSFPTSIEDYRFNFLAAALANQGLETQIRIGSSPWIVGLISGCE
jgi:hypothetical protein